MFHMLAHITGLLIVAFFVLFAAGRADGVVKLLGTILGWWLIILAAALVVMCVAGPMFGGKPFGMDMEKWHGGWMHHGWMHSDQQAPQPATPAAPAPAKPAAPAKPGGH